MDVRQGVAFHKDSVAQSLYSHASIGGWDDNAPLESYSFQQIMIRGEASYHCIGPVE